MAELRENRPYFLNVFKPTQMIFLAVCRAWRDIALATPALWSTLQIRFETIPRKAASEPQLVEEFIDRWLGRAALRPLSILFDTSKSEDDDYAVTPSRVHNIIHRYASNATFPLLRRVAIKNIYYRPHPLNPINVFSNAPQLREFSMFGATVFSSCKLPAFQLTKIEGNITDLELFSVAPNLTEVKCSVEYLDHVPPTIITHARLEFLTLIIKTRFGGEPKDIFPHLTLPALLSLDISDSSKSIDAASISSFLTRSAAPLHTLSVNIDGDAYDEWVGSLTRLDNTLENLTMYSPSEAFLTDFMDHPSGYLNRDYHRLPRLQNLTFINAPHINFELLVEFLVRRSRTFCPEPPVKLKSFRLVSRLASTGMDIHVGSLGRERPYVSHVLTSPSKSISRYRHWDPSIDMEFGSSDEEDC
ncbi:hypothetical protein B0H11DRAFT_2381317 [Mycena galericulata]|nr:hypothetical protein B0H11DRAFT_2381317 [Mycena galericulata]